MKLLRTDSSSTPSVIIIVIGIAIAGIAILLLHIFVPKNTIIDDISIVGVIASIVGVAITMTQVSSVKNEVVKNSKAIRTSHSIADFNGESKRVSQIRDALPRNEYKFIMWQISELKTFLAKQKTNPIVKDKKERCAIFDEIIPQLGADVTNLTKKLGSRDYVLNKEIILNHIDEVDTLLAEINGELVNNSYDPR